MHAALFPLLLSPAEFLLHLFLSSPLFDIFSNFSSSLTCAADCSASSHLFIKQSRIWRRLCFPASQGTFSAFEFVSNLAHTNPDGFV